MKSDKQPMNNTPNQTVSQFLLDGLYWTECSGGIEHLCEKHEGMKFPNEYAFEFLQSLVILLDDGYHYERKVKGETQRKIIYGFKNQEMFEAVKKDYIDYIDQCVQYILDKQINETMEKPSFGRLSKVECSVAIINFFVDLRWEEDCYDLFSESLEVLAANVDYLKNMVGQLPQNKRLLQAIENGEDLINTTSIITIHKLSVI